MEKAGRQDHHVEVTGCKHGGLMVEQDRQAAVEGYLERADELFLEFEQFWSEPKHSRLIDAKMVRYCFAYAAESALGGQMTLSRGLALLGIYLATWFKLGKDTFLDALGGMLVESSKLQTMLDYQASMDKVGTERGLVLFLSKQIPCSCLDEDEKKAKQAPKKGLCHYCSSEELKLELKKCSQCKWALYCSKKCQKADWSAGHKEECEIKKRQIEQQVASKAKTRR